MTDLAALAILRRLLFWLFAGGSYEARGFVVRQESQAGRIVHSLGTVYCPDVLLSWPLNFISISLMEEMG